MEQITLSCSGIETRQQLHAALADALHFPDWYGSNLDALYDCLTDLRNIHLVLENWNNLPDWRIAFQAVLEDAESQIHGITVTFQ